MFARRLVPVTPFLLLALESWVLSIERRFLRPAAALALIAAAALPYPVFGEGRWRIEGIADEPHFYPKEAIATRREQGERLGALLRATPARVMFEGGMCVFAYYSKLPYLVEMTGLTQYSLARLPLAERGLIGHEKQPDDRWLDENDIHLVVAQEWPIAPAPPGARRHDEVYFGNLAKARIWLYSDAVMDALRGRPEVSFIPIEQVIERLRAEMEAAPFARASAIHDYLDRYYLRAAGARGAAIEVELQAAARRQEKTGSRRVTRPPIARSDPGSDPAAARARAGRGRWMPALRAVAALPPPHARQPRARLPGRDGLGGARRARGRGRGRSGAIEGVRSWSDLPTSRGGGCARRSVGTRSKPPSPPAAECSSSRRTSVASRSSARSAASIRSPRSTARIAVRCCRH